MILIDQLISPLEQLINEHGSSVILQKHLEFVKSQLANYETRYRELEAENVQLKIHLQKMESALEEFHCHCKGI